MVNATGTLGMLEGHFVLCGVYTPALSATVESLVTAVCYTVLIRFPIVAQWSKGVHYFHRVVGLVVNIRQWVEPLLLLDFAALCNILSGRKRWWTMERTQTYTWHLNLSFCAATRDFSVWRLVTSDSDSVYWTCSQKAKNQKAKQTIMHCTTKQNKTRNAMQCNAMRWKKWT